jgi:aspartate-semialdehyde dehydrogenase
MAFNLIPKTGDLLAAGKTVGEWRIESQTRRLLELLDLPISVTSVRVPTFHGVGYTVNVETEAPLDAVAARDLLRAAPGILLSEEESSSPYPTLIDALEMDATCVGRVRDDPTVPYGLNLWVTIDGSRKGGAVNAVQIAELVIRDYL